MGPERLSVVVVDYHKGNLKSVERGLGVAGIGSRISDDPTDIAAADGIVLPGVGAFADASATMRELGQMDAIRARVAQGVPFLGICLGLQLAFEQGSEGCAPGELSPGLGFMRGTCERMPVEDAQGRRYKIPHVGWNDIELTGAGASSPLFSGIGNHTYFYFTHSYCCVPADGADVLATTTHSVPFASAVARDNVYGVQFHPEKSSGRGLAVLANFARIVERAAAYRG